MTTISDLATLAHALSLPIHPPAGLIATPHLIFRGPLMSFHHRLDELRIAHEVTIHPEDGFAVRIDGLVVERGGMGGVVLRDAFADVNEKGKGSA